MPHEFQTTGNTPAALFTLKLHRGDGMCLLAMNWKEGTPPRDFVGFSIEYQEPGGARFYALKNRLAFPNTAGDVNPDKLSTRLSPIQKFRWVHFPRNAEASGDFIYRVAPVFMNGQGELSYGEAQRAAIELSRETCPGQLNIAYTRGFVASQSFVDKFVTPVGPSAIRKLLPLKAAQGLDFKPTHPQAEEALAWMGFEARKAILDLLDQALADASAEVRVVAFDLCEPEIVERLEKLKGRLKIIIDDSGEHKPAHAAESVSAERLRASAGAERVKRQHMGHLQHNKTIVVTGTGTNAALCGSTNFAWRGLFVQNNHVVVFKTPEAVATYATAFDNYWKNDSVNGFGATGSATWNDLKIPSLDARVAFSPHLSKNAVLKEIASDIAATESSLLFSLAFLNLDKGPIRQALTELKTADRIFCYGVADTPVKGLSLLKPDGKTVVVSPEALAKNLPAPFKAEPTGGSGTRMHHKFVVLDFDKPTARVYFGSYNFSKAADLTNGENLVCIRDRRIATSFAIEALRIFDHYHFRTAQEGARQARKKLQLVPAPKNETELPWWDEYYSNPRKARDRELFA